MLTQLIVLELFSVGTLAYVSKKEFDWIFNFSGKSPDLKKISNLDLAEASIDTIFKIPRGEFVAFAYPILFVCCGLVLLAFLKLNGVPNKAFLYGFIIMSMVVVACHIVIPYFFTYLKYYEEALKKGFNFRDWMEVRLNTYERSGKNEVDADVGKDLINDLKKCTFVKTKENNPNGSVYADYCSFFSRIGKLVPNTECLSEEEYIKVIPFLRGRNYAIKEKLTNKIINVDLDSTSKIETSDVFFGVSRLGSNFFQKVDLQTIFISRYAEIAIFYLVVNILLYAGSE